AASYRPSISADGSFVAYAQGDSGNGFRIMLRQLCGSATPCQNPESVVSIDTNGQEIRISPIPSVPAMSADARFVAFAASDWYQGVGFSDVGIRDTCNGTSSSCFPSTLMVSADIGRNVQQFSAW